MGLIYRDKEQGARGKRGRRQETGDKRQETRIQGYRDTGIQGYRDNGIKG